MSPRNIARATGVLFILTFITSIAGVLSYGSALSDPNYVTGAGADAGVLLGAFLEVLLIITNIGCAIVLYPLLKRHNETLALAYVAARIVECTFILVGLISVLAIETLRQTATVADASSLLVVGRTLHAIHDWTFLLGPGFSDGVGTGMILGWLMYRSGVVSRRMALFGVIGGPLLAASGIAVLLGVIPQGGAVQGIATIPEVIWEAFLGLWLTVQGVQSHPRSSRAKSGSRRSRRPTPPRDFRGPRSSAPGPSRFPSRPAPHPEGLRPLCDPTASPGVHHVRHAREINEQARRNWQAGQRAGALR